MIAHPRYRASRMGLVDSIERERSTMKATPYYEFLRHRFDHDVFNHDAFHSGQRWGSVAEAFAEVNCNPLLGRNPVRLDLKCYASLIPSPPPARTETV